MKAYKFEEYFANVTIPDSWAKIEDFVEWYMNSRMPIMIPGDPNIIIAENATAITLFRKPPYQVELYINYPNMGVDLHEHPGMEVITMSLGPFGGFAPKLTKGKSHGGAEFAPKEGNVMLTFEKWPDGVEMTSAAANWKGKTAGPLQDAIIRNKYPRAYIKDGYADVTKEQEND